MKAAPKKKWVKALRSGRFTQGKGALYDPGQGRHCCLGVLHLCAFKRNNNDAGYLTDGQLAKVGLTVQQQMKLAGMNDDGATFEQIADYIEKNL